MLVIAFALFIRGEKNVNHRRNKKKQDIEESIQQLSVLLHEYKALLKNDNETKQTQGEFNAICFSNLKNYETMT